MTEAVEHLSQGRTRNAVNYDFTTKIQKLKDYYKSGSDSWTATQKWPFSESNLSNEITAFFTPADLTYDASNENLVLNDIPERHNYWLALIRRDTNQREAGQSITKEEPHKVEIDTVYTEEQKSYLDARWISWIKVDKVANGTSIGNDKAGNKLYLNNGDNKNENSVSMFKKYLKQAGSYWLYLFTGAETSSSSVWENKLVQSYKVNNKVELEFKYDETDTNKEEKPIGIEFNNLPIDDDCWLAIYNDDNAEKNKLGTFYGSDYTPSYDNFCYIQYKDKSGDTAFMKSGKDANNTQLYSKKTENKRGELGLKNILDKILLKKNGEVNLFIESVGGVRKKYKDIIKNGQYIQLNIPIMRWSIKTALKGSTTDPNAQAKIQILTEINDKIVDLQATATAATGADAKVKELNEKIQKLEVKLARYEKAEEAKKEAEINSLINRAKAVEYYLNNKKFANEIKYTEKNQAIQDIEQAEKSNRKDKIIIRDLKERANVVKKYLSNNTFATIIKVDQIFAATTDIEQAEAKKIAADKAAEAERNKLAAIQFKKANKTIKFDFPKKKIKVGNSFPYFKGEQYILSELSNKTEFTQNWERKKQAWGKLKPLLEDLKLYNGEWLTMKQSDNNNGGIDITVSSKFIITNAYFILKDKKKKNKFADDDNGNFANGYNEIMQNNKIHTYTGSMKEFSEIFEEIYFETGIETNIIYSHTETSNDLKTGGNRISLQVKEYNKFRNTEKPKTLQEIKDSIDIIGGDFNNNKNVSRNDRNVLTTAINTAKDINENEWEIWKNFKENERLNKFWTNKLNITVSKEDLVLTRYLDKNGKFVKDGDGNFKLKVHPACLYGQQLNKLKSDIDTVLENEKTILKSKHAKEMTQLKEKHKKELKDAEQAKEAAEAKAADTKVADTKVAAEAAVVMALQAQETAQIEDKGGLTQEEKDTDDSFLSKEDDDKIKKNEKERIDKIKQEMIKNLPKDLKLEDELKVFRDGSEEIIYSKKEFSDTINNNEFYDDKWGNSIIKQAKEQQAAVRKTIERIKDLQKFKISVLGVGDTYKNNKYKLLKEVEANDGNNDHLKKEWGYTYDDWKKKINEAKTKDDIVDIFDEIEEQIDRAKAAKADEEANKQPTEAELKAQKENEVGLVDFGRKNIISDEIKILEELIQLKKYIQQLK